MKKVCVCGKEYLYPRDFWQHKDCAPKVGEERVVKSETVVFKCPVCEARKKRQREKMKAWRAKK